MAGEWTAQVAVPLAVKGQIDQFVSFLCENEQENLIGIYLHGSLAMNCFRLGRSDIDLLVLLAEAPAPSRVRAWAQQILQISLAPAPIEISILHRSQYAPWSHPTPFCFHYSEDWRTQFEEVLADPQWHGQDWEEMGDYDLAGHFTVAHRRGICLAGAPTEEALPPVPWADYLDSILRDFDWACERADANPVYLALNACRTWAAVADQLVLSKAEGAAWAQPRLPAEQARVAAAAAAEYAGVTGGSHQPLTGEAAQLLADYIARQIR
jgi:streptomycin 3"-adenylyltransferase